jgi:secreted trypsin-like serine protease
MRLSRRTLLRVSAVLALATVFGHLGAAPTLTAARGAGSDIVGGREAAPGAWPWHVALLRADVTSSYQARFCSGTLIDPSWVLTSADCVMVDRSSFYSIALYAHEIHVGLGIHNLKDDASTAQRIAVAEVVVHPDFFENGQTDIGDIALLRLSQPARLDQAVQAAPLVASKGDPAIQPGSSATLTGWGLVDDGTRPDVLHEVDVSIQQSLWCELVGEHVLCAAEPGRDACDGDEGGPLVVRGAADEPWRLAGVTGNLSFENCGHQEIPTRYTNVAHYRAWIAGVLARPAPGLEVELVAPEVVPPRSTFTYRILARNPGRATARKVKVADEPPYTLDLLSVSQGGRIVVDPTGLFRYAEWVLPELAAGATAEMSVTVRHVPQTQAQAARRRLRRQPRALVRDEDGQGLPTRAVGGRGLLGWQRDRPAANGRGWTPLSSAAPDIVGGRAAAPGAWPWQVAVEVETGLTGGFCGGSLIAPDWVLTAAHCMFPTEVRLGSNQLSSDQAQRIKVSDTFPNMRYFVNQEVDIALVKLERPATLSSTVKPIALADAADAQLFAAGKSATVTGWGMTSWSPRVATDDLQELSLPIVDADQCGRLADPRYTLCAGSPDGAQSTCYGDSGGPLVVPSPDGSFLQIGVVSRISQENCGAKGALSLFASPSAVRDWIDDTMATEHKDTLIEHDGYGAESESGVHVDGHIARFIISRVVPASPPPIMPPTASTPEIPLTPTPPPTRMTPAPGGLIYLPSLNNGL